MSWRFSVTDRSGWILLALLLLTPVFVQGWFAFRGAAEEIQEKPIWNFNSSVPANGWKFTQTSVPAETMTILGCSQAEAWKVKTSSMDETQLFHFFWRPHLEVPSLAVGHTPDLCMPRAGWELVEGPVPQMLMVQHIEVPGALFRFRQEHIQIVVWHAIWKGGRPQIFWNVPHWIYGRWDRLSALWQGRRDRGQEVLTLIKKSSDEPGHDVILFGRILEEMQVDDKSSVD